MLKVYMGILIALLISDISGTVKLFQNDDRGTAFWFGVVSIILLSLSFVKLAKYARFKVKSLASLCSVEDGIEAGSDTLDPDNTKKPKSYVPILSDDTVIMVPMP